MNTEIKLSNTTYESYFQKAVDYDTYRKNFQAEMAQEEPSAYAEYLPQNWSRQSRLDRKLKLTDALVESINKLDKSLKWLVITEHWCGDASQINPIIGKIAELSEGKIDLRFIYRDENEELINAHLTDGRSKSIPILLCFDAEFNLLGTYGPRPEEAQELVKSLLAQKESYNIPLHTWYAKDKQQATQQDLQKMLSL
jgi:hypothetical protein